MLFRSRNLPVAEMRTQEEQIRMTLGTERMFARVVGSFGMIAALLAAIGLYAVMSYTVSQGIHEFGLRMALGAGTKDLLKLVMSRGVRLTATGIMIGAAAGMMLTRLMGSLLYKVSPRDPLAFGLAFLVITIASLAACFLPAWRATRIDPVRALRNE